FKRINTTLDGWKGGTDQATAQTTKSNGTQAANRQTRISSNPPNAEPDIEDEWLQYVNKFIQAYGLDKKQDVAARSIYEEQRKKAKIFRESKKTQFEKVRRQFAKAKGKQDRLMAEQVKFALEAQICRLFVELEKRLDAGLTSEQSSGIESNQKTALEIMAAEFSGRNMVKRMRRNIKSIQMPRPDPEPKSKDSEESKAETTTKPAPDKKSAKPVSSGDAPTSRPKETAPAQPSKTDKRPKPKSKASDPA
ncbi:MAG: hypothetical protein O7B26_00880, partial [Planctomycetota bacterium]|nr:hypothetical protein [Planctomycetota bacterium]